LPFGQFFSPRDEGQTAKLPRVWRASLDVLRWRLVLPTCYERTPFDKLLRWLDGHRDHRGALSAELVDGIVCGERVAESIPLLPKTCLFRSLARFAVLRARGIDAAFVMGLPRDGAGNGHAWVEVGGVAVLDDEDLSSMTVTFCYPPAARTYAVGAQRSVS
jgi:Transglutaminase-like superfamily